MPKKHLSREKSFRHICSLVKRYTPIGSLTALLLQVLYGMRQPRGHTMDLPQFHCTLIKNGYELPPENVVMDNKWFYMRSAPRFGYLFPNQILLAVH